MIQLAVIFQLLDELRTEALQAAEAPDEENRNAFGFGRVAGMLAVTRAMKERLNEFVEEQHRKVQRQERA